jgi:very-short-patch-repair endonuclease
MSGGSAKMKDGKKQLSSFFDGYIDDLRDSFNNVISDLQSPIEEILCASMLSEALLQCSMVTFQGNDDGLDFGNSGPDFIRIKPQYQIGKYKVDFYLEYYDRFDSFNKKLIVECDGHEFHEKTKEQAQHDKRRDRFLQGVAPVFRFTGSEIVKEPHDCAYQIIDFLMKKPE